MKTKIACDGRQLEWEPKIEEQTDEETGEVYEFDLEEPGFHKPPVTPGLTGMNAITYLMTHGRTCDWCKEYLASPMETVLDQMEKPNPFWVMLKKKMGRR